MIWVCSTDTWHIQATTRQRWHRKAQKSSSNEIAHVYLITHRMTSKDMAHYYYLWQTIKTNPSFWPPGLVFFRRRRRRSRRWWRRCGRWRRRHEMLLSSWIYFPFVFIARALNGKQHESFFGLPSSSRLGMDVTSRGNEWNTETATRKQGKGKWDGEGTERNFRRNIVSFFVDCTLHRHRQTSIFWTVADSVCSLTWEWVDVCVFGFSACALALASALTTDWTQIYTMPIDTIRRLRFQRINKKYSNV